MAKDRSSNTNHGYPVYNINRGNTIEANLSESYPAMDARKMGFKRNQAVRTMASVFSSSPSTNFNEWFCSHFKTLESSDPKTNWNSNGFDITDTEGVGEWIHSYRSGFKNRLDYTVVYTYLKDSIITHVTSVLGSDGLHCIAEEVIGPFIFKSPENTDFVRELRDLGLTILGSSYIFLNERNLPIATLQFNTQDKCDFEVTRFFFQGLPSLWEKIKTIIESSFDIKYDTATVTIVDGIDRDGLVTREIDVDENSRLGLPEFYPWMNGITPAEYFTDFMLAEEPLVVLRGLPGTGKSTFILTGVHDLGLKALMISKQSVIANPSFISTVIKHFSKENKYDLIIIEDGDALMVPRDKGNLELNELLSVLQGIGNIGIKLFITTNKDTTEGIDTALIRHGRCYDNAIFGRLDPAEALAARKKIGLSPKVFKKPVTLAQALKGGDVAGMISSENPDHIVVDSRYPLKNHSAK